MKKIMANGLLLLMLVMSVAASAQSKTITISGKITSFEESLPLEGVSVQARDSKASTGTMADGSFSLPVSTSEKTLLVSLPGYERKEVPVTGRRDYDIVLKRLNNINDDGLPRPVKGMQK